MYASVSFSCLTKTRKDRHLVHSSYAARTVRWSLISVSPLVDYSPSTSFKLPTRLPGALSSHLALQTCRTIKEYVVFSGPGLSLTKRHGQLDLWSAPNTVQPFQWHVEYLGLHREASHRCRVTCRDSHISVNKCDHLFTFIREGNLVHMGTSAPAMWSCVIRLISCW
jgi:hypothetical protein